ncbi:MAG: hypothetical protein WEB03_13480 [Nitriliruptor sp.]|uniref:hypothetical protein n=1 Tax=Nitriliruptor sp. TaxID=2448056 RepID=UPI0034A05AFA
MSAPSPTLGRAGGEHRVLEPPGAAPLTATRLDALAELWDGELRLDLEALVLNPVDHRAWIERLGSDPVRLAGALVESIAERGGFGAEASGGTVIGRIVTIGDAHPHEVELEQRVGVALPATALPVFAAPGPTWDGGRVVPLTGHAIVPARAVTVPVGDTEPTLADLLTRYADLPATLPGGQRTLVIGFDRPGGALAVAIAAREGRHVSVVVGGLAEARLARALGADATAVLPLAEPVEGADHLRAEGRADLVVLADPAGAALAARSGPAVQIITEPAHRDLAAAVLEHAQAAGCGVAIHAGRGVATDRGDALHRLLAGCDLLRPTLRWLAGTGPRPTVTLGLDDEELP